MLDTFLLLKRKERELKKQNMLGAASFKKEGKIFCPFSTHAQCKTVRNCKTAKKCQLIDSKYMPFIVMLVLLIIAQKYVLKILKHCALKYCHTVQSKQK